MPNWCNNNITITGPNSVIDKIEKIVKEEEGREGIRKEPCKDNHLDCALSGGTLFYCAVVFAQEIRD